MSAPSSRSCPDTCSSTRAATTTRSSPAPRSTWRPTSACGSASSGSRPAWSSRRRGRARSPRRESRATRWSTRCRRSRRARSAAGPEGALIETKAIVTLDDRRYVLDGPVAVLGRSRECDCVLSDPNVSRQHAELRRGSTGDWQIVDLGSTNGIKVNDRRVDRVPALARATRSRSGRRGLPSTSSNSHASMDTEPIAVALKFGFLAVLYLFLFWVARSAFRELRRTTAPAPEATGIHPIGPGGRSAATDAWLVAVTGGGLEPGRALRPVRRASRSGARPTPTCGSRTGYASGVHARVYSRGANYYVEDMNSTNGTFLNGGRLDGEAKLNDLDEVRIGDTEFRSSSTCPGTGADAEDRRTGVPDRHGAAAERQRGLVLRPPAGVRRRRRNGRRAGRRGGLAAGGRVVRARAARRGVARGLPAGDREDGQRAHPPARPGRLVALGHGDDADRGAGRGRRGRASLTSATAAPTCSATAS